MIGQKEISLSCMSIISKSLESGIDVGEGEGYNNSLKKFQIVFSGRPPYPPIRENPIRYVRGGVLTVSNTTGAMIKDQTYM
ncbi:hypothetical protein TNCV_3571511 [Trichonephila clavipes]|nr:hypothetical protein TNCV_3571511 [Trichonephila clavipes]